VGEQRADVVVIGAGIVGCSTAYYLAKRGARVTVLEAGEIGAEQSSRNWGFVRQQGRDPAELPLVMAANRIWRGLSEELDADIEWVQEGNLGLAADEERMQQFRDWLPVARDHGLDTRVLSRAEVLERIPAMTGPYVGGMFTPGDGHAQPNSVMTAFARAAERHGATIVTGCAAQGFELTGGAVSGVVTAQGLFRAPVVVNAAGARAGRLARLVGLSLPTLVVRATVAETTACQPITGSGVWAPGVAFRQRRSGRFYIAGGAQSDYDLTFDSFRYLRAFMPNYLKNRRLFRLRLGQAMLDDVRSALPRRNAAAHRPAATDSVEPTPNLETARRSLARLRRMVPAVSDAKITRVWAGMIDATPDAIPVIGAVDDPQGLIFATGFSGHGFAMGPIAGLLVSELILDGKPSIDISAFRFSRFREGQLAKPRNVL
jgi:glycine/D-amino acid oxidase-like deaminating enzyme